MVSNHVFLFINAYRSFGHFTLSIGFVEWVISGIKSSRYRLVSKHEVLTEALTFFEEGVKAYVKLMRRFNFCLCCSQSWSCSFDHAIFLYLHRYWISDNTLALFRLSIASNLLLQAVHMAITGKTQFIIVRKQISPWTLRKSLNGTSLDLIDFLILKSSSFRNPVVIVCHLRILKLVVHHWRLIRVIFIVSKVVLLIVEFALAVFFTSTAMTFDDICVSAWSIWRIIYNWHFSFLADISFLWTQPCSSVPASWHISSLIKGINSKRAIICKDILFSSSTGSSKGTILRMICPVNTLLYHSFIVHFSFILFYFNIGF